MAIRGSTSEISRVGSRERKKWRREAGIEAKTAMQTVFVVC